MCFDLHFCASVLAETKALILPICVTTFADDHRCIDQEGLRRVLDYVSHDLDTADYVLRHNETMNVMWDHTGAASFLLSVITTIGSKFVDVFIYFRKREGQFDIHTLRNSCPLILHAGQSKLRDLKKKNLVTYVTVL